MSRCALVVAVLALLVSGCNQHQPDDRLDDNKRIADDLGKTWRELPKVDTVEADYLDSADALNEMHVEAWCSGCERAALADRLVADIWKSSLTPLSTITVSVADEGADGTVRRNFYVPDEEARLRSAYGERPDGTTSK